MLEQLDRDLRRLCAGLNQGSRDYTVSMGLFPAAGMAGEDLGGIARAALGPSCTLRGAAEVATIDQVLSDFDAAIAHPGDAHSHPNPAYAASAECAALADAVRGAIRAELGSSESVYLVWFAEGHPFYPVFWEFAYLIERGPDAVFLVASSSD